MDTNDGSVAVQRPSGGSRYAAATLFLVGGISTLTQIVAVASLGLPVTFEWSTGGLVALIAAIWMWIQCRSWEAWRRWVWIPVIITVVLAFGTIYLMAASANEAVDREAERERAAMCAAAETELASMIATHESLLDQTWVYSETPGERQDGWLPQPGTGNGSSWRDLARERGGFVSRSSDEVWAVYVSYGGPQVETYISQYEANRAAACGSE